MLTSIVGISLIGLIVIIAYALNLSSFQSLVIGVFSALASACLGGLFGMLFGIPKSSEKPRPTPSGEDKKDEQRDKSGNGYQPYNANTNLEQISDWLTKIIVGVGLTQFHEIATALKILAAKIAAGMTVGSTCQTPATCPEIALGLGIVISYSISGFVFAYLWTRRYLLKEFTQAEREASATEKEAAAVAYEASKEGNIQHRQEFASPPGETEEISAGLYPDDPWKGAFGGKCEVGGYRIEASVLSIPKQPGLYAINLLVKTVNQKPMPSWKKVTFFLHPTFERNVVDVGVTNGEAKLPLIAWGAFTVGARTDDGIKLELDLSKLQSAPAEFRLQ